MITAKFFFFKLLQGLNALLVVLLARLLLDNEQLIVVMSFISLNALVNLVDGGLSINILHHAAKYEALGQIENSEQLRGLSRILYRRLASIYGFLALLLGTVYINTSLQADLKTNIFWIVNVICCALYLRCVGEMTFLEGFDKRKKIIETKLIAGVVTFFLVLGFMNTEFFAIAPALTFFSTFIVFMFDKPKFQFGLADRKMTFRTAFHTFKELYLRNQINLIISWIAGYLAFNVTILILIARVEEEISTDLIVALNLQILALGFTSVFMQPKLNQITQNLQLGNLKVLTQFMLGRIMLILLVTVLFLIGGRLMFRFNFISNELFLIVSYISINWFLLSVAYFVAFLIRSFFGERLHYLSLAYGFVTCCLLYSMDFESVTEILNVIVLCTSIYAALCCVVFIRKLKLWMNMKTT